MPMSESAPSNSWFRFVRPILNGLLLAAVFGFFWWQLGTRSASFMAACFLLGIAASAIRKAISRRRSSNRANRDERARHERVLSPVPIEAEKARARLVWQFVGGVLYLAFISLLLTELTNGHFLLVFSAVTSGVIFTGAMLLVWATGWAQQASSRRSQFSIATLLFLTTILAVYLGVIRLLADLSGKNLGAGDNTFLAAAVICLILTGFSLPFLLLFMESLVWLAAWLVRRPWVQAWLRR